MQKFITLISALAVAAGAPAQAPAFPGAEGFGRYTTGGRGGKVLHVTNLNDDKNPGSLRWAINQSGKRIIVFDVAGRIDLKEELKIGRGDLTILGQTAPGDGICLSGFNLTVAADNVIIRFIRVRPGCDTEANDGKDAMGGRFKTDIIVDHCSTGWSTDEACSFYINQNFTMQWCYVTESLRLAGHSKEAHGYGGIWGGASASFHHNLLAHHDSRNPRFGGSGQLHRRNPPLPTDAELIDMRNCVVYNWGGKVGYGAEGGSYNFVNNYYKPGPGSTLKSGEFFSMDKDAGNSGNEPNAHGIFYVNGNTYEGRGEFWDWKGMRNNTLDPTEACKSETPFDRGEVTTHSAADAFDRVLSHGGCSLVRDAIDTRISEEARLGTATYSGSIGGKAGIIDTHHDVGGWPEYKAGTPYADRDNDGMPDVWEIANGLDPDNASDATKYTVDTRGWYTNIEVYANWLVEHIMKAGNEGGESNYDEYYPSVVPVDLGQSGLEDITADSEPVKVERFDLTGRPVGPEYRGGVVISRITYADGHSETFKTINH